MTATASYKLQVKNQMFTMAPENLVLMDRYSPIGELEISLKEEVSNPYPGDLL